jgi:hypothetical protein
MFLVYHVMRKIKFIFMFLDYYQYEFNIDLRY